MRCVYSTCLLSLRLYILSTVNPFRGLSLVGVGRCFLNQSPISSLGSTPSCASLMLEWVIHEPLIKEEYVLTPRVISSYHFTMHPSACWQKTAHCVCVLLAMTASYARYC